MTCLERWHKKHMDVFYIQYWYYGPSIDTFDSEMNDHMIMIRTYQLFIQKRSPLSSAIITPIKANAQ